MKFLSRFVFALLLSSAARDVIASPLQTYKLDDVADIACFYPGQANTSVLRSTRNKDGTFDSIYFFAFRMKNQHVIAGGSNYELGGFRMNVDPSSVSPDYGGTLEKQPTDLSVNIRLANTGASSDNSRLLYVNGTMNFLAAQSQLNCEVTLSH